MRIGPENTLGVDDGGTRIRVARIGQIGRIVARLIEPMRPGCKGFSRQILRGIGGLRDAGRRALGNGISGRVDGPGQKILSAGYPDVAGLVACALIAHGGRPMASARLGDDAGVIGAGLAAFDAPQTCLRSA